MNKIKYIFADIDGVLTDGKVYIDAEDNEHKCICYHDLDAIGKGRRNGLEFAFITGEDTFMAHFIAKRFKVPKAIFGCKDKEAAVKRLLEELKLEREEISYIGDAERDIPAIKLSGLGAAPADALKSVRDAADVVLERRGGEGALMDLVTYIIETSNAQAEDIK